MCRNGQNSVGPIEYYVSDQKSKFSQDLTNIYKYLFKYLQMSKQIYEYILIRENHKYEYK